MSQLEKLSRRDFLQKSTKGVIGTSLALHASSSHILGANDRVTVAIMGTNGRGSALARSFARIPRSEVMYICDVDTRAVEKGISVVRKQNQSRAPEGLGDVRKALDDTALDALAIAAPDHWHTPASILALKAGKHVYVEKPLSHDPQEGELLIQAKNTYNKVVQMGDQRRSWPIIRRAIEELHSGVIGKVYYARTWYANTRGSIGYGHPAPVPSWLNYDLWQGPAPRRPFIDNRIHYNWHWFWHWGTGEALNNGTHEVDVARWGLDVDYPLRVSSAGGRYHWDDDWETPDTQVITWDFEGEKTLEWEGRSCNGRPIENVGRGTTFHGTEGTLLVNQGYDGSRGYVVYDMENTVVKRVGRFPEEEGDTEVYDTSGPQEFEDLHMNNFLDAIIQGVEPHSFVEGGHKSVLLCHLGNIAQRIGRTLNIDQRNGHIIGDKQAMQLWSREYEPGWEPVI